MHPSPHLFDAVARGEGSRELLDEVWKEHLSALCPVCAETLAGHEARLARAGGPGIPSEEPSRDRLDPLRRRLGLRELELRAREREARAWVRRAVKLSPDVRRDKVANAYVRFRGPLFCLLLLEEARRRIPGDPDAEDWLRGYAHYNLAHHLHAGGETDRAEAELAAHEELIESASDQLANLLVWLKARIAWSRQDLAAAQRLYTEARRRALDRGIAWDAGLVGLELAR